MFWFFGGYGDLLGLDRGAFVRTRLDEERASDQSKVITVRMNKDELERLEAAALYLGQEKISTALKQLFEVGLIVLHDPQTKAVLDLLFNNERKNKRLGIELPDPKFTQM